MVLTVGLSFQSQTEIGLLDHHQACDPRKGDGVPIDGQCASAGPEIVEHGFEHRAHMGLQPRVALLSSLLVRMSSMDIAFGFFENLYHSRYFSSIIHMPFIKVSSFRRITI